MSDQLLTEIRDLLKRANEMTEEAIARSKQVEKENKESVEEMKQANAAVQKRAEESARKFLRVFGAMVLILIAVIGIAQLFTDFLS